MIKKMVLYSISILLTLFVVLECVPTNHSFGFVDYINILFCNTKTYALYGRTNWNLINLMYFLITLSAGIYYISDKIRTYNSGFLSMTILRYGNCKKYLISCQKQNFKNASQFLGIVLINIFLSIFIIDMKSFGTLSALITMPNIIIIIYLIFFILKMFLLLNIIEIWLTFLILSYKFEFLILLTIIFIALMLFADIFLGLSFVTLSLDIRQIIYSFSYLVVYIISFSLIKEKYKKKEFQL